MPLYRPAPSPDSLRLLGEDDTNEAVDRARYRAVQTPQTFDLERLHRAYEQPFSPQFTDDASVYEAAGLGAITLVKVKRRYQRSPHRETSSWLISSWTNPAREAGATMAKDFLLTPLTYLPGVGPRRAKALAEELDLYTYLDLLHYFPTKYVDRSRIYQIRELRGEMPHVELKGYIRDFKEVGEGRKKRLVAYFTDGTGTIELVWFRSMPYIRQRYIPGQWYLVFGKPVFFNGAYSISHPEIDEESKAAQVSGGLMPVYPLTEKLTRAGLNSRQMRQLLYVLKEACVPHITETLTPEIIERARLMSYAEAIEQIHFPVTKEGLEAARRRLKFDELFFIQLRLLGMKRDRKAASPGLLLPRVGDAIRGLYGSLPFDLTGAQKRVIREIQADVISGRQMNRLIQGDVGSGKTLVALFSMLLSVDNGYQACMMAPTEILARQHYASLCEYLAPLGIEVGLLIGSTKKKERTRLLADLSTGALKIIVGTPCPLRARGTVRPPRAGRHRRAAPLRCRAALGAVAEGRADPPAHPHHERYAHPTYARYDPLRAISISPSSTSSHPGASLSRLPPE